MIDQPAQTPCLQRLALLIPLVACLVLVLGLWVTLTRKPVVAVSVREAGPPELDRTNLMRLGGLWCEKGRTNPFTGVLLEFYPGGQPMSRSVISNGLLNGLSEGWFTNGQMEVQEIYRDNLSDGVRTKWYPNGHKLSEATIVRGKMEGIFRHWHADGSLAEEIPMHAGRQEGVGRAWYPSGYLAEEVEVRDGKVVNKRTWKPGERKGS